MNYELLNNMINYIEENLTENILYNDIAKQIGVSEYNLQRIFSFLTGISLAEYIRKRRLSKAFEELKATDIKIIDLAIKYQYDSSISFSRAFKNYFGITPTTCRNSNKSYKLFPIIEFNNDHLMCHEQNYEVKELDSKKIYYASTPPTLRFKASLRCLFYDFHCLMNYEIIFLHLPKYIQNKNLELCQEH